jgi:hypothetical protein
MKKSDKLKQLLRQMIREEVADQVNKAMGKILVEMLRRSKAPVITEEVASEPERPIRKILTGNAALDSVLAETAANHTPIPRDGEGVSLVQLMSGDFEKIGKGEQAVIGEPTTKIGYLKQIVSEGVTPATQTSVIDSPEVPDMLKKVFKKDFRSVMKAMDRQKKEGTSGMFAGKIQMEN